MLEIFAMRTPCACRVLVVATALMGIAGSGCEERRAPAAAPAPKPPPTDPSLILDRPLLLLRQGRPEGEAVAALRELEWNDPGASFTVPVLKISEAEFVRRPQAEQMIIQRDGLAVAQDLRRLAQAAVAEAKSLEEGGKREEALELLADLKALGLRLSDPESKLELLRMIGVNIVQRAEQMKVEMETGRP